MGNFSSKGPFLCVQSYAQVKQGVMMVLGGDAVGAFSRRNVTMS